MINATIIRNDAQQTVGFKVKNHGETSVCAAVSMLVINTVNSIETLTTIGKSGFRCDYNENGGFFTFSLKNKEHRDAQAGLLLDALVLGLTSAKDAYPGEIKLDFLQK